MDSAQDSDMFKQIRSLQKYCNAVASNKLLWSPEILAFFQIPDVMLPRFELDREKHSRKLAIQLEGAKHKSARCGSYADMNEYLIDTKQDGF